MDESLKLRKVNKFDIQIAFKLANDVTIRQNSFNTNKITWDEHVKWFNKKIVDDNCDYRILENKNGIIGMIRIDYDICKKNGIISYGIFEEYRKKGYGTLIINMITNEAKKTKYGFMLIGKVKKENIGSVKCFEKNGYSLNIEHDEYIFTKVLN